MKYELTKYAGKRQRMLLKELHHQGIITQNRELGLWQRGALSVAFAKELLKPTDKTLKEKIDDLEPLVNRLEADAERSGIVLTGTARHNLILLKNIYKEIYGHDYKID